MPTRGSVSIHIFPSCLSLTLSDPLAYTQVMIALANVLQADPWLCLPHMATDSYVRSFAALVSAQLQKSLRAYIEYSNEVWNGMFGQTDYAKQKGIALGLNLYNNGAQRDDYIGLVRYYSLRSQQIFDLFYSVYGSAQAPSRLVRVMATQAVVPFFTDTIMQYGSARTKTDAFAIAPYFGMFACTRVCLRVCVCARASLGASVLFCLGARIRCLHGKKEWE